MSLKLHLITVEYVLYHVQTDKGFPNVCTIVK